MNASMQYPPVPDENRGSGFLACSTIITVAALITVTLRFYVRARIVHAVGWDDWIILLAMVTVVVYLQFVISMATYFLLRVFLSFCWLSAQNRSPWATADISIMSNSILWNRSSSIL